ncbi:MAG TPA: HugZ family protein [Thiotrichaceae bacterium]|jgi:putative heme iron utilization protein|nr:HugZ family protein [Thiotrichaceae bacterium]HIM08391.1 HugZ family protein [Gammaproteobacteria bacterium]
MNQNKKVKQARKLLLSEYQAILCTHSVDVDGYPFGSVVPYCLNKDGEPIMLISSIAQHTKNILSDHKVSLIATEGGADDLQTVGRITYIGNAQKLNDDDIDSMERYYSYFPQSRDFHKTHDFDFYRLEPVRIRYIGGFGKIYWVEKDEFLLANPFSFEEEKRMVEHMNADHLEAIKHYCETYEISHTTDDIPVMVGIDSEGFNLRVGARIHRIDFNDVVTTAGDIRKVLVEMAKT